MAKPEWGVKRICRSCGTRFYDFKKDPITCPSCETVYEIIVDKPAKPSKADKDKKSAKKEEVKAVDPDVEESADDSDEINLDDIEDVELDDDDSEEDSVIEDLAELEEGVEIVPSPKPTIED